MRLRTDQVFMRFSWAGNVLAQGGHHQLIDDAQRALNVRFSQIKNVARRTDFRELTAERKAEWLPDFMADEAHPILNVSLRAEANEHPAQMTIFAGPHPYTGRYVVQYELLMPREAFESASAHDTWVRLFRSYAERWGAICGHMHDADDNSIQNTASAGMLKLGFGVEVDEVNLAENPGREVSRGEFRFAINWLNYFGPEMVARLTRFMDDEPPELVEELGDGWFIRLADGPLSADADEVRQVQRFLRGSLAIQAATEENARAFGFWQRK